VTLKRNTCECGCGTPTRLAPYSDRSKGWVAGEPVRFITGHNMFAKRRGYVIEDRGYETPCWIWQGVPSGDNGYGRMPELAERYGVSVFTIISVLKDRTWR
jgi:hypothetical protein